MTGRALLRWFSISTIANGLALLIGGRRFARLWQAIPGPGLYRRSATWFAGLPS